MGNETLTSMGSTPPRERLEVCGIPTRTARGWPLNSKDRMGHPRTSEPWHPHIQFHAIFLSWVMDGGSSCFPVCLFDSSSVAAT